MGSVSTSSRDLAQPAVPVGDFPLVSVFMCANCARSSRTPELAGRSRPDVPSFEWPFATQEVLLPCAGRLQPEHVLKAFEAGARLVCAIACREGNCHYLEGSTRCARRIDYVRGILDEIGLGGERLLLFYLPGTAAEDMAITVGRGAPIFPADATRVQVAAIREAILHILDGLSPTPLAGDGTEAAEDPYQRVDTSYDSED
jgi:coenzyme F420-reducing hydrogenase delta subunit